MNADNAFKIIDGHPELADFCGSVTVERIRRAEQILGVKFPKSYFQFLEKYGAGDIAGIEIYGIIKDPETDGHGVPNGIWLTLNLREEAALPKEFVIVTDTGCGPYYVLDTSETSEDSESPIYMWDVGNQKQRVAESFGEFLFTLLKESI